jgi:hypothetical protein
MTYYDNTYSPHYTASGEHYRRNITKTYMLDGIVETITKSRILMHNTCEYFIGKVRYVRHIKTDVIVEYPDGAMVIDFFNWPTTSTQQRINDYQHKVSVFKEKGEPYVCKRGDWDNKIPVTGMIHVGPRGKLTVEPFKPRRYYYR